MSLFNLPFTDSAIFASFLVFTKDTLQEGPVIVIADSINHRLALWGLGDDTVWKHLGSEGREPGWFRFPTALVVTDNTH